MSDVSRIGPPQPAVTGTGRPRAAQAAEPTGNAREGDRVELSETAQLLAKLAALPDVRQDLVDRVKAEIAAGTYDTDAKLDQALDNLIDEET